MPAALAALVACMAAGGCIHSDTARSGVIEGRPWSERVADRPDRPHIEQLRSELLALGEVSTEEAEVLADEAVRHAEKLRRDYRMVRPIEVHNVLVNLGLRKRGLCYQCAEDMYVHVRDLRLKTFDLHWGVAHKDDLWLEHSGVIVTAKGRPFSEGLVLDAWRHSGRLRWARVADDRYPWVRMYKKKFPELRDVAPAGPPGNPMDEVETAAHPPDSNGAEAVRASSSMSPGSGSDSGSRDSGRRG